MFKNNWWEARVAKHDNTFLHMGPLEYGYRTISPIARGQGNCRPVRKSGFLYQQGPGDYNVSTKALTEAERMAQLAKGKRMTQAGMIVEAVNNTKKKKSRANPPSSNPNLGSSSLAEASEQHDFVGPVEQPPKVQYTCPRYDEIKKYLLDNRAPGELALDTMTILSEPQFYRYIREHGGINLTGLEFRNFLAVADQKGELFM